MLKKWNSRNVADIRRSNRMNKNGFVNFASSLRKYFFVKKMEYYCQSRGESAALWPVLKIFIIYSNKHLGVILKIFFVLSQLCKNDKKMFNLLK